MKWGYIQQPCKHCLVRSPLSASSQSCRHSPLEPPPHAPMGASREQRLSHPPPTCLGDHCGRPTAKKGPTRPHLQHDKRGGGSHNKARMPWLPAGTLDETFYSDSRLLTPNEKTVSFILKSSSPGDNRAFKGRSLAVLLFTPCS